MNIDNKYYLNQDDTVLLVIDIQERLAPAMHEADDIVSKAKTLVTAAGMMKLPVLATEQYPRGLGATVKAVRDVLPEHTPRIEKISFDAYTDEIKAQLQSIRRQKIIVTGMETHVCVYQTVRRLLAEGYDVHLPADAVGSRNQANKHNALALMRDMGAVITNTETILFDLLQTADTPLFKQISALIK